MIAIHLQFGERARGRKTQLFGNTHSVLDMFDSNSFGSLAMESSSEAGPSRIQNDGEEVDADVGHLLAAVAKLLAEVNHSG